MPKGKSQRPAYALMLAEAERLGLPTSYRNDLWVHDLAGLEKYDPKAFIWTIYDCGTHFVPLDLTGKDPQTVRGNARNAADYVRSLPKVFGSMHWYLYRDGRLRAITDAEGIEAVEAFVAEADAFTGVAA